MSQERLILFAKAPVPGRVKTRLTPPLTPEGAAALYRGWCAGLVQSFGALNYPLEIAYASAPGFPDPSWMTGEPLAHFPQEGGDLGEKLVRAFTRGFQQGAERVVVIGSDSPGLPAEYIEQAFAMLRGHDLALGPAQDGGYYLVGLRGRVIPALFQNIDWSTDAVLAQTLAAAAREGLAIHLLPPYFDIDRPEDLRFLAPSVSVVLPVRNEAERIEAEIDRLRAGAAAPVEIVVVDGQSGDDTIERAARKADRVLSSPPGRARQMHLGAQAAKGGLLLFLHADTRLPEGWHSDLTALFTGPKPPAAAAFRLGFDSEKPLYRLLAALANFRNRLTGIPHGDQALAVTREAYFAAGGFPDAPLMEEYLFVPRLRRLGGVRILPGRVATSARKYERRGPLRNALKNLGLVLLFYLGVPPKKLAEWY